MSIFNRSAALMATLTVLVAGSLDAQGRVTRRESHGEVRNRVTVSTIVTALDNTGRVLPRLERVRDLTPARIRIIDVRPYVNAGRRSAYTAALNRNGTRIERLRDVLGEMDVVTATLAGRRPTLDVDDVVAAAVLEVVDDTGRQVDVVVLYVDPRNRLPRSRTATAYRPTTGTLFAALHSTPEMVARVSVLGPVPATRIRVFNVATILTAADRAAFAERLEENHTSLRSLRVELGRRPAVLEALAAVDASLRLGHIVAADIIGSGDVLVLYVDRGS